jgi:hypothetical protein
MIKYYKDYDKSMPGLKFHKNPEAVGLYYEKCVAMSRI